MKIGTWILTILLAATAWAQNPAPKPQAAPAQQATPKPQAQPQQAKQGLAAGPAATQLGAAKPNVSSPAKAAAAASKSAAPVAKSAKAPKTEKQASASSKAAAKSKTAKNATQRVTLPAKQAARNQAPGKQEPGKQEAGKQEPGKQEKDAKAAPNKTVAKVTVHKGKRDPFVGPMQKPQIAVCAAGGKRCLFIEDLNLIGIVESPNGIVAVVANGRHTYFLREHDPLADGEVLRITSGAITLHQRTTDVWGKPVERDVTRKIGMPAV